MSGRKSKYAKPRRPVPLSRLELQMPDQLDYLRRSMQAYDEGHTNEYRRLATTIRVLLHSTRASTSLVRQLQMEDTLFVSYARPINPNNLMTEHSLAMMRQGGSGAVFMPVLDQGPPIDLRWLSLEEWLAEPVLRDVNLDLYSRWDFIRVAANQDGGAHVDSGIEETYAQLQEGETVGWVASGPDGEVPMKDIERCYLRHISFEVVLSLDAAWQRRIGNRLCECGQGRKARYCCLKSN